MQNCVANSYLDQPNCSQPADPWLLDFEFSGYVAVNNYLLSSGRYRSKIGHDPFFSNVYNLLGELRGKYRRLWSGKQVLLINPALVGWG